MCFYIVESMYKRKRVTKLHILGKIIPKMCRMPICIPMGNANWYRNKMEFAGIWKNNPSNYNKQISPVLHLTSSHIPSSLSSGHTWLSTSNCKLWKVQIPQCYVHNISSFVEGVENGKKYSHSLLGLVVEDAYSFLNNKNSTVRV